MSTRHVLAITAAALVALVAAAPPASAKSRNASIGNYYFQDDATKDRKKLVVTKGDQIVFTNVEGVFPPHTVEVDELDIHSGAILQGQTYTTPPLNKVGNFLLYCMPHRDRGHHARLIVNAKPAGGASSNASDPTTTAAPTGSAGATSAAGSTASPETMLDGRGAVSLPPLVIATAPPAEQLPSGIGQADPDVLARAEIDPDSLEGLLSRNFSGQPWTRAVWWLLLASVPIVAAAALVLRRNAQLRVAAAAAEAAAKKKRKPAKRKKTAQA